MHIERTKVAPVWTRSFPAAKQPQTIGEHLRKKRFNAGMRQSEAAQRLRVSERTLSLWEHDQVYPTWPLQPSVIKFLGYDPFTRPELGRPKGNETKVVAFLGPAAQDTLGAALWKKRMELKKNRKQCARELGVCVKTLRAWEMDHQMPGPQLKERIASFLASA